jgi:hypothetical protein
MAREAIAAIASNAIHGQEIALAHELWDTASPLDLISDGTGKPLCAEVLPL